MDRANVFDANEESMNNQIVNITTHNSRKGEIQMETINNRDFVETFMKLNLEDPYTVIDKLMEHFNFDKRSQVNGKIALLRKKGVALPELPRGKKASGMENIDDLNEIVKIYSEEDSDADSESDSSSEKTE